MSIVGFAAARRNDPRRRKAAGGDDSGTSNVRHGWSGTALALGDLWEFPCGLTALKQPVDNKPSIFDDFEPFPACPRACARGALVARTGRLVGGHLGRFPSIPGMLP
jgi:hypothetical protein